MAGEGVAGGRGGLFWGGEDSQAGGLVADGLLLVAVLMGQFSRIFIAGAFTEATLKAFFMRQMPRGGELIPAEGVIRFGARATLPIRDLVTWDMDNMQKDLRNMARNMAVTRLPLSLYENYIEAAE